MKSCDGYGGANSTCGTEGIPRNGGAAKEHAHMVTLLTRGFGTIVRRTAEAALGLNRLDLSRHQIDQLVTRSINIVGVLRSPQNFDGGHPKTPTRSTFGMHRRPVSTPRASGDGQFASDLIEADRSGSGSCSRLPLQQSPTTSSSLIDPLRQPARSSSSGPKCTATENISPTHTQTGTYSTRKPVT